jgi:hypothetical protein
MARSPHDAVWDAVLGLPIVAALLSHLSYFVLDIPYCTDFNLFKSFVNLEELELRAFDSRWACSLTEEEHDANEKKFFDTCSESCIRLRKVRFIYEVDPDGYETPRHRTYRRVSGRWEAYEEDGDEEYMPHIYFP